MVRNKIKCIRHGAHYIVAHLLRLKMIRDKSQHVWVVSNCLVTHFLSLKAIRGKRSDAKRSGSMSTASLHNPCVLMPSGTAIIKRDKSSKMLILFISLGGSSEAQNMAWGGDFCIR